MDPIDRFVYAIQSVHNVLRRSLDQLLLHAASSSDSDSDAAPELDVKNYLGFLSAYLELLEGHHAHEEKLIFPELQSRGVDMSQLEGDHQQLETIMAELKAMAQVEDLAAFSLGPMREKLSALKGPLEEHLAAEETAITVETFKKAGFTSSDVEGLENRVNEMAKTLDGTLTLPLMYYHLTEEEKNKFWDPNLPWLLRWIIFPLFICRAHKGYWEFAQNAPTKKPADKLTT